MGLSYNPPAEAHQDLLRSAVAVEQQLQEDEEKVNTRLLRGREEAEVVSRQSLTVEAENGMPLDPPGEEAVESPNESSRGRKVAKEPKRKSKQARRTETRLKIEVNCTPLPLKRVIANQAVTSVTVA